MCLTGSIFTFRSPIRPTSSGALFWPYFPANTTAMATQVSLFSAPAMGHPPPAVGTGPTNYAFCSGDGSNGGDATNADGAFILGVCAVCRQPDRRPSQTVAASEHLMGIAGPYSQPSPVPVSVALEPGNGSYSPRPH